MGDAREAVAVAGHGFEPRASRSGESEFHCYEIAVHAQQNGKSDDAAEHDY